MQRAEFSLYLPSHPKKERQKKKNKKIQVCQKFVRQKTDKNQQNRLIM